MQQEGQERAQYGKKVIRTLPEHLTEKFGRGSSKANLEFFRRFYLNYEERIVETVFRQFAIEKTETVFRKLEENPPFIVSWSHYLQLMRIEDKEERSFYSFYLFYKTYPEIFHTACGKSELLSWSHYRLLIHVDDSKASEWYRKEDYEQT